MRVSLNEFQSAARKAARGAGWPYALAEDLSKAAAALTGSGGNGAAMALRVITDEDQALVSECLLAFELALAGDGGSAPMKDAELVSALAMSLGAEHRTGFDVSSSGMITRAAHKPTAPDAADVDAADWERLNKLAMKSYVPASAESRLGGAGAGLTDND